MEVEGRRWCGEPTISSHHQRKRLHWALLFGCEGVERRKSVAVFIKKEKRGCRVVRDEL